MADNCRKEFAKIFYLDKPDGEINVSQDILKFLFVLDKKKLINMTREESDSLLPKLISVTEKYVNNYKIGSSINVKDLNEIVMMFSYFGLSFDINKLKNIIQHNSSEISFSCLTNVKKLFY